MKNSDKYSFEIGPIRPPSEGGVHSLLLRITRNCPWNNCAFCPVYKGEDFEIRKVDDVKEDIDAVKNIRDMIVEDSENIDKVPRRCLSVVSGWVRTGEKTVFLQDSNSVVMRTEQLVDILDYLNETFPYLDRITSYARSKTLVVKSSDELKELRNAGLTRLHVGLESGDDEVLEFVNKGVTAEEHIEGGNKALEAGFELSEYVMPGLGGKKRFKEHAKSTANVLNEIDPHYIRLRPLAVLEGIELYEKLEKEEFELSSPHERLEEIKIMVENLEVNSKLCFDHRMNGWRNKTGGLLFDRDYEGYELPDEKELVLKLIEEGLEVDESRHLDARDTTKISL